MSSDQRLRKGIEKPVCRDVDGERNRTGKGSRDKWRGVTLHRGPGVFTVGPYTRRLITDCRGYSD